MPRGGALVNFQVDENIADSRNTETLWDSEAAFEGEYEDDEFVAFTNSL